MMNTVGNFERITKRIVSAALATGIVLGLSSGASAQSNEELKRQLDRSQKIIEDLEQRVKALEQKPAQQQSVSQAASSGAPVVAAGAPVVAPNLQVEAGTPNADKARLEITGQVMLDAIYDFKRVDPDWNATLRPSKIPVTCPGDAGCGKDGETILSVRQTKLGFKGYFPTPLGELTTLVDFDLFDSGGGNTHARLLDAWAELGMFGAGQYYTLFMDVDTFPNTIDYWGPNGMVFVRNPQLRFTPFNKDGMKLAFSLEAPGSAIDTGKVSEIDPALGANVTSRTLYPDLIGSFRVDGDWGHVQLAAILRNLTFETPSNPGSEPSDTKTGYGVNLSGSFNTWGKDRITAAIVYGSGIASYMNDGGNDLAPDRNLRAETVDSLGWFVYYDRYWSDCWSSSIGYSEHHQSNTDGQLSNAFRTGSYASANLLYLPVKNVTTGLEFMWGSLKNYDRQTGDDYRLQFSTKYVF